jgi:hypothetical protein
MPSEFVQFPVPSDRVADVAIFLYGQSEAMPEAVPDDRHVPISAEQRYELLTRIYVDSEPTFRRLLMLLAERPEPELPMLFDAVTAAMGWATSRSLPGALGAYGRRAKHRYGGYWPFERGWDARAWSHYLTMEPDVATFLCALHKGHGLPTE